jgi:hypothetical protein
MVVAVFFVWMCVLTERLFLHHASAHTDGGSAAALEGGGEQKQEQEVEEEWGDLDAGECNSLLSQRLKVCGIGLWTRGSMDMRACIISLSVVRCTILCIHVTSPYPPPPNENKTTHNATPHTHTHIAGH